MAPQVKTHRRLLQGAVLAAVLALFAGGFVVFGARTETPPSTDEELETVVVEPMGEQPGEEGTGEGTGSPLMSPTVTP